MSKSDKFFLRQYNSTENAYAEQALVPVRPLKLIPTPPRAYQNMEPNGLARKIRGPRATGASLRVSNVSGSGNSKICFIGFP